ncbi:MAG: single-stranded-DNA-specific exonuclease RecJ [Chthoniobacterales bacterium]
MEKRWVYPPQSDENGQTISWAEICGMPCILELLKRKAFATADEVDAFLRPRLRSLSDPFLLPNMRVAVTRLLSALEARERIVLFGDYDVDGVTSLALLAQLLRAYGAAPRIFLPLRMEEGYGLSPESVRRCLEQHSPGLLIAVDCGTSSVEEISDLQRRGVDVIVLDHHEPKTSVPKCVAIVNPKLDPASPFHYLCSVGIVFKLCHALLKTKSAPGFELKANLDLVALGTVADLVPLSGENRVLVRRGAIELARSNRPGMRKLIEVAGVRAPISSEDIGFRLGPRLNAAGRLDTAENALQLLMTEDDAEATSLAQLLDTQNRERQAVEKAVLAAAEEEVLREFKPERDAAIVVGRAGWHPGVVGIVASRLMRKYHRPTIVVGFESDGTGKGSGRSIDGFSIVDALGDCQEHLEKFGGHEMAAGLTVKQENFAAFAGCFRSAAKQLLSEEQLQPCLLLDSEVELSDLNSELLRWHEMLQPFGNGNPQPLFFAREVLPAAQPQLLKGKHLVLRLRQRSYHQRAIFFDGAASALPAAPWDVAFRISSDEYEGQTRLQLHVQALRSSTSAE